MTGRGVHQCRQ